jgi:hypothetical protein
MTSLLRPVVSEMCLSMFVEMLSAVIGEMLAEVRFISY